MNKDIIKDQLIKISLTPTRIIVLIALWMVLIKNEAGYRKDKYLLFSESTLKSRLFVALLLWPSPKHVPRDLVRVRVLQQ
jgi:hypothetical protein